MIKVITGIRRCGKSYLLLKLFKDHLLSEGVDASHIICIELDDPKYKQLRNDAALYEYISSHVSDDGHYYVFLDEIQFVDGFSDVLNGMLHIDNVDCYVTGSNSKFLSNDIITEFRGRGDEIRVYPLSYSEYKEAIGSQSDRLDEYMMYGGMPAIVKMDDLEMKMGYLTRLFDEIYLKDIMERHSIGKKMELEMITDVLCSSIGSLTNPSKICDTMASNRMSIDYNTVSDYIGFLEDSFLIHRVKRYDVKGRRYISTPCKFYLADTGLRNARLNFRQFERTHLMENVIFQELKMRGYSVDVGMVESRTMKEGISEYRRLEIDFVANRGFQRYYIQSAYVAEDEKRAVKVRPFLKVDDSFKKIIVVRDNIPPWKDDKGVLTIGLELFLTDPTAMDI